MKTSIKRLLSLNLALILLLSLLLPAYARNTEDNSDILTDPVGTYTAGTYKVRVPEDRYYVSDVPLNIFNASAMVKVVSEVEGLRYVFFLKKDKDYTLIAKSDFTICAQSLPIRIPTGVFDLNVNSNEAVFVAEESGYYRFSTVTLLDLTLLCDGELIGRIYESYNYDYIDFYVKLEEDRSYQLDAEGVVQIDKVADPVILEDGFYDKACLYTPICDGSYDLQGIYRIYDINGIMLEKSLGFYELKEGSVYYIEPADQVFTVSFKSLRTDFSFDTLMSAGYYTFRPVRSGLYRVEGNTEVEAAGIYSKTSSDGTNVYMEGGQEARIYSTEPFSVSYFGLHDYTVNEDGSLSYKGYYGNDRYARISAEIHDRKVKNFDGFFTPVGPVGYGLSVELEYGIESVGKEVFNGARNRMVNVVLPESVKTIDYMAFSSCQDLILTIPQSVEYIHPDAITFGDWDSLEHVFFGGTEEQWDELMKKAPNFKAQVGSIHFNAGKDDYTVEYSVDGVLTVKCNLCDKYIRGACRLHGNTAVFKSSDNSLPTCAHSAIGYVLCSVCNTKIEQESVRVPAVAHSFTTSYEDERTHSIRCEHCDYFAYEAHSETEGNCPCTVQGDTEVLLDESLKILHSLDLASDIGIHFILNAEDVVKYHPQSFYMDITKAEADGTLVTERIEPEYRNGMYYFTYRGTDATTINDVVQATFYARKDGKTYRSPTDEYSVAEYAYSQLSKDYSSEALKALCANLLRYGTAAQLFKDYKIEDLADSKLTQIQRSYLTDLSTVEFEKADRISGEITDPTVPWEGKSLVLDSKITLRFVVNLSDYDGDPKNLSLRIRYRDADWFLQEKWVEECVPYGDLEGLYTFDFSGLLAAEMRTELELQVYESEKAVSHTRLSTAASYGNNKEGDLLTLCQALMAYSDAAKAYFAG